MKNPHKIIANGIRISAAFLLGVVFGLAFLIAYLMDQ